MKQFIKSLYNAIFLILPSLFYQSVSSLKLNVTNRLSGRIKVIKKNLLLCVLTRSKNGELIIGNNFKCKWIKCSIHNTLS